MKMKNLRKIKCMTLIIAIIIPMMIGFSSFITNAKADTYIDVENYGDNQWHWGVDEGDTIMFEVEYILSDPDTGNLLHQFKDIMIYNVSSIENVTKNVSGENLVYSHVNTTRLYYNTTLDALIPLENSKLLAEFSLNNTHPLTNYDYMTDQNLIPLLLPLNSSNVIEWDNITNILNDTMYTHYADANFTGFDDFGFNRTEDSFWFRNYTDGSFLEASYYNSHPTVANGTIKEAKGSVIAPFGFDSKPMMLNFTGVQVFDYNVTDEVVWGVDVGDTFIYDLASKGQNDYNDTYYYNDTNHDNGPKDNFATEIKVIISKFNETTFWLKGNSFDGGENDTTPITFQGVYANVYFWNFTLNDFVLEEENYLVGAANNFYPIIMGERNIFVIPISATQADFEYIFNPDILQNRQMPFDDMNIVWGSIIHFELWNSTGPDVVDIRINGTNGVFMNYLMKSDWDFTYYELKNMTYIDWNVDIGDRFYFKQFSGDHDVEVRVTVLGFGSYFDNLSFFFDEFLGLPLPAGQPELQFFSVVMGFIEHWDRGMERWVSEPDPYGPGGPGPGGPPPPPKLRPIAAANKYWAIAPPMLGEGPPLLLPNGTTGYDPEFQNLFDIMGFMFDDVQYGLNWVSLSNTTAGTYMQYNFSTLTGMTTLMHGWSYNYNDYFGHNEWNYFSIYNETVVALVPTLNTITLHSLWVSDVSITAEISVFAPGADFIYALNSINPVNEPIPMGDEIFYLDIKITNHSLLTENITLEITIPSYIDLITEYLYFYGWYMGGGMMTAPQWYGTPQEFYDSIVYDYPANSLVLEIPNTGPLMMLLAVGYGTEPPVTEPEDFILTSNAGNPDDDGSFMLSWTESTGADSYSVYVSNVCITDITQLLIPIASDITDLNYSITDLPNSTYYFVIVAHNIAGDALSNCLEVIVGTGEEIPGYNILIVLVAFVSVSAIIIKKRRKQ